MKRKLTAQQQRLLSKARDCPLMISYGVAEPRWQFSDGRSAPQRTADSLVRRNMLVPQGNSLFGESQTWAVAE